MDDVNDIEYNSQFKYYNQVAMSLFHNRFAYENHYKFGCPPNNIKDSKVSQNNQNLSPLRYRQTHKIKNTRYRPLSVSGNKTIINNPAHKIISCSIHSNKQAQYSFQTQQQTLHYCCLCASKLASQGFQIYKMNTHARDTFMIDSNFPEKENIGQVGNRYQTQRISMPTNHQQRYSSLMSTSPYQTQKMEQIYQNRKSKVKCEKYVGNALIEQVNNLSLDIEKLLGKYQQLRQVWDKEKSKDENEKQLIIKYYEKIIDIVESYRQKHLKKVQSAQLTQSQQIQQNMEELSTIHEDMAQTDFDEIIQKVPKNDFRACLDFYQAKYSLFLDDYSVLRTKILQREKQEKVKFGEEDKKYHQNNWTKVGEVQDNIDKIEQILRQFYEPGSNKQNKKPIINLIKQYEKADKPKQRNKNPFRKGESPQFYHP